MMNKSTRKKIVPAIAALGILLFASMVYYSTLFKNPVEYFKAKGEIERYIEEHYKDNLILEKVSYNSKMSGYVGLVTDKNDTRYQSFIAYYPNVGQIEDDYHFRTKTKMEEQLQVTITTLAAAASGIPSEKMHASPIIEIPKYKYRITDKYNPEDPIKLDLTLKVPFANIDDFCDSVYKILSSLYDSKLYFNNMQIYSFTPENGDKSYTLTLREEQKITSLEEVKKAAYIKGWEKK
jgi:hypothetical protein